MSRPSTSVAALAVGAFHLAIFVPFARLGIDPHHDGIMLYPALALADGQVIHRDVFSQYGPLTSMVHALFVHLLGEGLLTIRLASAVFLATAQGLLFVVNSRLFGKSTAIVVAFLSLCLTYFLSPTAPMHPWPSDLLLLVVSLLALLASVLTGSEDDRVHRSLQVAVGLLSSLVPFIRQSSGIAVVLLLVTWTIFRRGRKSRLIIPSFLVGLVLWVTYFAGSGSLQAFWDQSVVGPWRWAFLERGDNGWGSLRGNLLNQGLVGLAVCLAVIKLFDWMIDHYRLRRKPQSALSFASLSLVAIFLMAQDDGVLPFFNRESLLWILGIASVLHIARISFVNQDNEGVSRDKIDLTCLCLFLPIVTIFPVTDIRHAYWAFIPLLGIGMNFLSTLFRNRSALITATALLCLLLAFQSVSSAVRTVRVERVSVPETPVMNGMLFDAQYFRHFEKRFQTLAEIRRSRPNTVVFNICADGLFASLGAIENLPDPFFVSWNHGVDLFGTRSDTAIRRAKYILERRPVVWMCPLTEDPQLLARRYKLRLIPIDSSVPTDGPHSWWPYISYLGVPQEWDKLLSEEGQS